MSWQRCENMISQEKKKKKKNHTRVFSSDHKQPQMKTYKYDLSQTLSYSIHDQYHRTYQESTNELP